MKKTIVLLLALIFTISGLGGIANAATIDQPSSWATERINEAIKRDLATEEIKQGYQIPTTRGEFCRLVINLIKVYYRKAPAQILEERNLTAKNFADTNDPAIGAAAALGIVSGTGGNNFEPDKQLTRQEAAAMLRNAMLALELRFDLSTVVWADEAEIAGWALGATAAVYRAGIMSGTSNTTLSFSPRTSYSHEMALITMLNLWHYADEQRIPEGVVYQSKNGHVYDMSDQNVRKHPIYATVQDPAELRDYKYGLWKSAEEIIEGMKNEDPDYLAPNGMTVYEYRMKPIQTHVDVWLAANNLSIAGKTDRQLTGYIQLFVSDKQRLEQFIGLWRPNFRFTSGDCVPRAEAVRYLMLAMDFALFDIVGCYARGTEPENSHATNAYWDEEDGAIKFIDSPGNGLGVWDLYIDQLDEKMFYLD